MDVTLLAMLCWWD